MNLQESSKSSWLYCRWIILLIMPIGYWLTASLYNDQAGLYFSLNFVSCFSLLLVISTIKKFTPLHMVVALIMMVLILGYYIKFYMLSYAILHEWPATDLVVIFGYFVLGIVNTKSLMTAYTITTYSFLAFSITSNIIVRNYKIRTKQVVSLKDHTAARMTIRLLCVATVLFILTSTLLLYIGDTVLPMKIGGVAKIINSQVVPYLMIMVLGYSYHTGSQKWKRNIAMIFLVFGMIQFLMFHSKLHLIMPLITIVLFKMIYGTYAISVKKILPIALAMMTIYPFLNLYRNMANNLGQSGVSTMLAAIERGSERQQTNSLTSSIRTGLSAMVGRVEGLSSLIIIVDARDSFSDTSFLDILLDDKSIAQVLTRNIIGAEGRVGIAEGFLGGFYFVTANEYGTAMLVSVWVFIALFIAHRMWSTGTVISMNMVVIWTIYILKSTTGGLRVNTILWFVFSITVVYVIVKLSKKIRWMRIGNNMGYL